MNFLIAPAIGWGSWLLLHSVAIPLVYCFGKKGCCMKKQKNSSLEQE